MIHCGLVNTFSSVGISVICLQSFCPAPREVLNEDKVNSTASIFCSQYFCLKSNIVTLVQQAQHTDKNNHSHLFVKTPKSYWSTLLKRTDASVVFALPFQSSKNHHSFLSSNSWPDLHCARNRNEWLVLPEQYRILWPGDTYRCWSVVSPYSQPLDTAVILLSSKNLNTKFSQLSTVHRKQLRSKTMFLPLFENPHCQRWERITCWKLSRGFPRTVTQRSGMACKKHWYCPAALPSLEWSGMLYVRRLVFLYYANFTPDGKRVLFFFFFLVVSVKFWGACSV